MSTLHVPACSISSERPSGVSRFCCNFRGELDIESMSLRDAWKKLEGTSTGDAQKKYVELVLKVSTSTRRAYSSIVSYLAFSRTGLKRQ